jgi:hypothetical protein
MPPQLERALVQVFVAPGEIFNRNSQCLPPKADLKVGLYVRSSTFAASTFVAADL